MKNNFNQMVSYWSIFFVSVYRFVFIQNVFHRLNNMLFDIIFLLRSFRLFYVKVSQQLAYLAASILSILKRIYCFNKNFRMLYPSNSPRFDGKCQDCYYKFWFMTSVWVCLCTSIVDLESLIFSAFNKKISSIYFKLLY